MEDKQYLIEAIIPSAKNVAANLGLKGKNVALWDSIVNNIITAINNDSYNPTSTYSTPKKGVFGYSLESLQSIADQMVAQIRSTKKTTSDSTPLPELKGSKYKSVYDYNEEWNDGYSSESIFKKDNTKTFDALITNVTLALNEVQALDDTTLLKGFKGKKENIDSIKNELNSLKGNFNEDNYNKFINILGNLGIDSSKINTYFESETGTLESNTSITNPDALPIKYNNKTIQYYDDPFSDDYGKIIYGDKTYNNLNDLYKATKDSELIKTINEKIKSDNDRFKSYDLNNLTGFYDLTFDDNGKYYDVTNVYGPTEDYKYILAKTDDINKFNWKFDNDFYGVTNDGKIVKIQNPSELLNNPNWYNITYDPEDFKTLLNAQYVSDKDPSRKINITQNIERPGIFNDLKIQKDGTIGFTWFNKSGLNTQELAKNYIDNFVENGSVFMKNVLGKGQITENEVKDFLLTLYHTVDDLDYKRKALELMKEYKLKFKNGGVVKFEPGNKIKLMELELEADNVTSEDVPQDIAQSVLTGAASAGSFIGAKKNNKALQLLSNLGLMGSAALDSNQEGGTNNISELATDLAIIGQSFIPKNWKNIYKTAKWITTTGAVGNGLAALFLDGDIHDKGNSVLRNVFSVVNALNTQPLKKSVKLKKSPKIKAVSTKAEAQPTKAKVQSSKAKKSPESNEEVTKEKFGGQLNYLKLF